jgi:gamma-glutamylputrescine oxidase
LSSTSFWQADFRASDPSYSIREPLRGRQETDIAIVGAGITGTSAALWLARAGIRACVLEARSIAAAASGRNGGFIADGTIRLYAHAIASSEREAARRVWAFSVANHAYAEAFVQELEDQGWGCDYRRNGSYKLAASAEELGPILESARLLNEDGWAAQVVQRDELPPRLRKVYFGGAFLPANAEIQPVRFVTGLARLAEQAGAELSEESPVTNITIEDDGVTLTTSQGTLHAQKLILATNAWLPEVGKMVGADWLARCITPTRGQVIATEPVRERILLCPCSAEEGYQYWRQLPDGRLIVGGWRSRSPETEFHTYDETPYVGIQRHLDAFVHESLDLPDVKIETRWAGIMAFTSDNLPLVGQLPGVNNCYICGGYTGHGNAFAINCARLVSELAMGNTDRDAELFEVGRFL